VVRNVVSVFGDDTGHPRATQQTCTALYGVGGKCEICCPGTDDRLAGHRQPRQRPRAEVGDPPVHLFGGDDLAVTVAVSFGFVLQARERIALLICPCDQERAGALDRYSGLLRVVAEQFVAPRDEPGFQRSRSRVEPGV